MSRIIQHDHIPSSWVASAHKDGAAMISATEVSSARLWGQDSSQVPREFVGHRRLSCQEVGQQMGCMLNSMVRSMKGWWVSPGSFPWGFWCLKGWGNHWQSKGGPLYVRSMLLAKCCWGLSHWHRGIAVLFGVTACLHRGDLRFAIASRSSGTVACGWVPNNLKDILWYFLCTSFGHDSFWRIDILFGTQIEV